MKNERLTPFLKWAGGKRWLVDAKIQLAPSKFKKYFEPFVGSGAVFFSLLPGKSVIADSNLDLITTYRAIRSDWGSVLKVLRVHQKRHSDKYYYELRSVKPRLPVQIAARFIYLNRTCWNALYRVNLNGQFNVPRGTKNNVLLDSDDFEKISDALRNSEIYCQDFESTINMAGKGDFIFVDPPYTVKHNLNGFIKYNEKIFSWADQVRLKEALFNAVKKGVQVTVSNADHPSVRALYSGVAEEIILDRPSVISANSKFRGRTSELLLRWGWSSSQ